jgi:hypothetical protein
MSEQNTWRIRGTVEADGERAVADFIERVPVSGGAHLVRLRLAEEFRARDPERLWLPGEEILIGNEHFVPVEARYEGGVYLGPLDKGVTLDAGPHPDFGLDDLAKIVALGTAGDSGDARLEITVRRL